MLNVWSRIALFIALAAFFISCHSKADNSPAKSKSAAETIESADTLKSLNLAPPQEEAPAKCEHYCKFNLEEKSDHLD